MPEDSESVIKILAEIIPDDLTFDSIWNYLSALIVNTPWHPYDLVLGGVLFLAYFLFPLFYRRKRYQIVTANSIDELENTIDRLISRDWYPRGGVVVLDKKKVVSEDKTQMEISRVYLQTMYKL